ncbi:VOC family protein [Micromonospora sp. NPDC051296]|uniref:VOC family protein n=1 Tax=Micromonospora sp. NPDC051296 TaxID=3155046 RepID=UPI003415183C
MRVRPTPPPARRPGTVACLTVGDIGKAVAYYEQFFGFRAHLVESTAAWLTGHGATLRLRLGPPTTTGADDRPDPDAVLYVRQPEVLRRRLDDWGAHLTSGTTLGEQWRGYYAVRDCYGNLLAFGSTGAPSALLRPLYEAGDDARRWLGRQIGDRDQRRESRRLRDFHQRHQIPRGAYYLHVTTGLLHWLLACERRLPPELPVVVVGSGLTAQESDWLARQLPRPFHRIAARRDDAGVLELVFAATTGDFGWIEPGCLVLDHRVLTDLAAPAGGVALRCAWSYDAGLGAPLAAPYLLFFDADAIRQVRAAVSGISPGIYAYDRFNRQVEGERWYTRTPSRRQRQRLAAVVPRAADGRPATPPGTPFYDTTVLYQLAARTCGWSVRPVRSLRANNHVRGGAVQDDASDELVYIGALGHADPLEEFSGFFHDSSVRQRYLFAEYVTLQPVADRLPDSYRTRLAAVVEALAAQGLRPDDAHAAVRDYLRTVLGLSAAATASVLQADTTGPTVQEAVG